MCKFKLKSPRFLMRLEESFRFCAKLYGNAEVNKQHQQGVWICAIEDMEEFAEDFDDIPQDILDEASEAVESLLPKKSRSLYEKEYARFNNWRKMIL